MIFFDRAGVGYVFSADEKTTEVTEARYDSIDTYPSQTILIPLEQPYGAFAKAMIERQDYPNLRDEREFQFRLMT